MTGYNYDELQRMLEQMPEELLNVLVGIILISAVLVLVLAFVIWIFRSVALYSMAKRRWIKNPWLAWLPMGNDWILGSLADQYRYVTESRTQNRRIWLVAMQGVVLLIEVMAFGIALAEGLQMGLAGTDMTEQIGFTVVRAMGTGLLGLLVSVLSITHFVFRLLSLYQVYMSCNPKNAGVYLVFSALVPVTEPFFLFANRKKEDGMPPRKEQIPEMLP